jgi:hypothetical protein
LLLLLLLLFAYAVVCLDCLLSHLFVRSLVAICGLVCQIQSLEQIANTTEKRGFLLVVVIDFFSMSVFYVCLFVAIS